MGWFKRGMALMAVAVLAGCGGGGATSTGGGSGGGTLYGTWDGSVRSDTEGTMDAFLVVRTESGGRVTGEFGVPRSLCIPGGDVTGTNRDGRVTFSGTNVFGGRFTVSGRISGNSFSGSYTSVGAFSCSRTDTGSVTLTKVYDRPVAGAGAEGRAPAGDSGRP